MTLISDCREWGTGHRVVLTSVIVVDIDYRMAFTVQCVNNEVSELDHVEQ